MADSAENDIKRSESKSTDGHSPAPSPGECRTRSPATSTSIDQSKERTSEESVVADRNAWLPMRRPLVEDSQDGDGTMKTQPSMSMCSVEQSQRTSEDVAFVLPDEAITERTLSETIVYDKNGKYSENLSDMTDSGELLVHAKSRNMFTTWYKRIYPLVRNKQVRYLSLVNLILSLINLILFLGIIGMVIYIIYLYCQVTSISGTDFPCVYQWTEWSQCSASCFDGNSTNEPRKTRKVNESTLVRARGNAKDCPDDILTKVDSVPCNTYSCPENLSSFPFSNEACFFHNPAIGAEAGCYRIREIPPGVLIIVDSTNLTEPCEQSTCEEMDRDRFVI